MRCLCNISALELIRASGRLLPSLLDKPRSSDLRRSRVDALAAIEDDLVRLGVHGRPVHLLVGRQRARHRSAGIACHTMLCPPPARSIIHLDGTWAVTSPELTFISLASSPDLDLIELALIGYELCGTYVLDASWDGLTNTDAPCTSTRDIRHALDALPAYGKPQRARQALDLVLDRSNSPMETIVALLLCAPRRLGGLGLSGAQMNYRIVTPVGPRYVDIAFPELNVGLEYKGRRSHSIERTARDDRRQNKLVGSGMSILNIWYEDLVEQHLFKQLIADLYRAANLRYRNRTSGFETKQALLRHQVLPMVERYGDLG